MWKIIGLGILICLIINYFKINFHEPALPATTFQNDKTFLKFPTYEEYNTEYRFEITNAVEFSITLQNHSDSNLVIIGGPSSVNNNLYKSLFYIIYKKELIILRLRSIEEIIKPNAKMAYIELSLDLANIYKPNGLSESAYNNLRDSIYTIAQKGILLYVPNEEDFKEYEERRKVEHEYSQKKHRFLKKPILISRDSTKFVYKSYLPPEAN